MYKKLFSLYRKLFFLYHLTADEVRSKGEFIGKFTTPVNNTYSVSIMEKDEENEVIVLIHEDDNEIAGILEAKTGKILYLHPRSIDGIMRGMHEK